MGNISTSVPSFIRSIAPSNLPSRITSNNATSLASDKKNTITKSTTLSDTYKSEKNNLNLIENHITFSMPYNILPNKSTKKSKSKKKKKKKKKKKEKKKKKKKKKKK